MYLPCYIPAQLCTCPPMYLPSCVPAQLCTSPAMYLPSCVQDIQDPSMTINHCLLLVCILCRERERESCHDNSHKGNSCTVQLCEVKAATTREICDYFMHIAHIQQKLFVLQTISFHTQRKGYALQHANRTQRSPV